MNRENVIFNICNRCNVKCRHCSNSDILNSMDEIDSEMLLDCLKECASANIEQVTFVGGEPFLYIDKLKLYCSTARQLGLKTCIITNGYWGKTIENARKVLISIKGLDSLLVSSDLYHLEHISAETIKNVIDASLEMGIGISMNATCASKEERDAIRGTYEEYKNKIIINTHMLMPIGAAKDLEIARWKLSERKTKLAPVCGIGNYLVEMDGEVHGCCNAILAKEKFLYLGNVKSDRLSSLIEEYRNSKEFNFIKKYGPRGIAEFVKENQELSQYMTKEYTCECEFCVDVMGGSINGREFIKDAKGSKCC